MTGAMPWTLRAKHTPRLPGARLRVHGLATVPHYRLVHKVQYVEGLHFCVRKIDLRRRLLAKEENTDKCVFVLAIRVREGAQRGVNRAVAQTQDVGDNVQLCKTLESGKVESVLVDMEAPSVMTSVLKVDD